MSVWRVSNLFSHNQEPNPMSRATVLAVLSLMCVIVPAHGQVAGSTTIDVGVARVDAIAIGWSAKKQILGHVVFNETGERVGKIDDLIVAPDNSISFAIIGAGGFVGLKRHQVALPVGLLTLRDGEFVLEGASKEAVKALPAFDYAKPVAPPPPRNPIFVR
jgi:hypothetical protein